jgi:hypothetical protein
VTLRDNLEVIHLTIGDISLKENEVKVSHIKIHYGDREMLKCNGIDVKLPRRQVPKEIQLGHDVSIEMKFSEF